MRRVVDNWVRAFWTGPSPACHSMRVRSNYDDPDPGVVASTSAHDPGVTKGRGSETAVTPGARFRFVAQYDVTMMARNHPLHTVHSMTKRICRTGAMINYILYCGLNLAKQLSHVEPFTATER